MDFKKEIEKINKKELEKIFCNIETKGMKLEKKRKHIFTIDTFEVFFRLYVDKNIQVFIRTNTINSRETVNYDFVKYNDLQIKDINEYRKNIRAFYKNILKEVMNTTYCPEHHKDMIPDNATQEEIDKGWACIYENRLLRILDYNKQEEFKEWLEKVTDKKYIRQQKSI